MFLEAKNALVFKKGNETLMIEPWGKDSFRVRSTLDPNFIDRDWALTEKIPHGNAKISVMSVRNNPESVHFRGPAFCDC